MKTIVVGRSPFADIIIADPSVAPHHAEVVITDDQRIHITDCATPNGTWWQAGDNEDSWLPVRQRFIRAEHRLRFAEFRCTVEELLRATRTNPTPSTSGPSNDGVERVDAPRRGLRGRVERDAVTGEIVRRRP